MSVWLVSSGSYSDYRVHAVAPDEATAQAVCGRLNTAGVRDGYDEYGYEERPLVSSADEVRIASREWRAWAKVADGQVVVSTRHAPGELEALWPGDDDEDAGMRGARSFAIADTEERARKIACDKLAQWRAEHELDPQP